MSEVVLKRPSKLQREVAKMRYETAVEIQRRKFAGKRNEARYAGLRAALEAERQEREAVVAAEHRARNKLEWQFAFAGTFLFFLIAKMTGLM